MSHAAASQLSRILAGKFISILLPSYFGQPSAGFFLDRDFFTRSFQLPFSFNRSAFGPGVAFFLEWFELLTASFLLTILSVRPLCKWVFVHQSLSLGSLYRADCSLTIIHLAIVPKKIKLPKIAMQIFTADIVISANQPTPDKGVAALGSINMNVATSIFKRPMTDRFVSPCPAFLELAIC